MVGLFFEKEHQNNRIFSHFSTLIGFSWLFTAVRVVATAVVVAATAVVAIVVVVVVAAAMAAAVAVATLAE